MLLPLPLLSLPLYLAIITTAWLAEAAIIPLSDYQVVQQAPKKAIKATDMRKIPSLFHLLRSTPDLRGTTSLHTLNAVWDRFWCQGMETWNFNDNACPTFEFKHPALTDVVVATQAILHVKKITPKEMKQLLKSILLYRLENGAFATSPGGDEIDTNENAQLVQVFLDAYEQTGEDEYLRYAVEVMEYIKTRDFDDRGAILQNNKASRVSTIATVQTARSALRLHRINNDMSMLKLGEASFNFLFAHLQDPKDKLFYDGLDSARLSETQKVVYNTKSIQTAGVAMSALYETFRIIGNPILVDRAVALAEALTDKNSPVMSFEKLWLGTPHELHYVFKGFYDCFLLTPRFHKFRSEVVRQANFIFKFLQDEGDYGLFFDQASSTKKSFDRFARVFQLYDNNYKAVPDGFCELDIFSQPRKKLLTNASIAQILYFVPRFNFMTL
ncbi:uncharacterized protein LODBEIA_P44980 [Lodderomyces beijingensis]|uniref:Uncharacterized protein n=1 Tax=Lodderomyces beijingensis TaxID=1775926 RepID=A0ABP0ZQ51_9ASCO